MSNYVPLLLDAHKLESWMRSPGSSRFGEGLFSGSRFLFWSLAPVLVLSGMLFAGTTPLDTPVRIALWLAMELALALLVLVLYSPTRFHWAARCLTGLVFLAYIAYLGDRWIPSDEPFSLFGRTSGPSPFRALVGFLVIGVPCLVYTVRGRFSPSVDEPEATWEEIGAYSVWAHVSTEGGEAGWQPWEGALPVDPAQRSYFVRAVFTLADGTELPGLVLPVSEESEAGPQPVLAIDGRAIALWSGQCAGTEELRDELCRALGRTPEQVFPVRFAAEPGLTTGVSAGEVLGARE